MGALSKRQELDSLDIISATSGGGYTLGWYFNSMYKHYVKLKSHDGHRSSAFLFEKDSLNKLLDRIKQHYSYRSGGFFTAYSMLWGLYIVPQVRSSSWITWAITGREEILYKLDESLMRTVYKGRLEKTFLWFPRKSVPITVLGIRIGSVEIGKTKSSLTQLAETMEALHLPIFIFNATIQGDNVTSVPLPNMIYEYTPFHQGSDGSGYIPLDKRSQVDLREVVATSGAAIDLPIKDPVLGHVRSFSGITLGERIPAHSFHSEASPLSYFYLSDGGHVENLATLSLLRRSCKHIVIVDAEQDEDYVFEGYRQLKALVSNYLGARLQVPQIEEHLEQHPPEEPRAGHLTWHHPWMEGAVETLPVWHAGEIDRSPIRITYLKLSFDPDIFPTSNEWRQGNNSMKQILDRLHMDDILVPLSELKQLWEEDDDFPHYPTIDQHGIPSRGQRALILLGMLYMEGAYEQFRLHEAFSSKQIPGISS